MSGYNDSHLIASSYNFRVATNINFELDLWNVAIATRSSRLLSRPQYDNFYDQ